MSGVIGGETRDDTIAHPASFANAVSRTTTTPACVCPPRRLHALSRDTFVLVGTIVFSLPVHLDPSRSLFIKHNVYSGGWGDYRDTAEAAYRSEKNYFVIAASSVFS